MMGRTNAGPMWVYDNDGKHFMVFDEQQPETAPVICREVRKEEYAKQLAKVPAFVDLTRNVAGLDDSVLESTDVKVLQSILREYREQARTIIDTETRFR